MVLLGDPPPYHALAWKPEAKGNTGTPTTNQLAEPLGIKNDIVRDNCSILEKQCKEVGCMHVGWKREQRHMLGYVCF